MQDTPDLSPDAESSERESLPLSRLFPNIVTILNVCAGLTAIRYALHERWEHAVIAIIVAGVLDGLDGRLARMLKATSTFGGQLDSLSDFISFGVAPALVMYIWKLHEIRGVGWAVALFYAVCCAIRLARFNTMEIEQKDQTFSERFFTGVPAPGGGGLAILWMMLTFEIGPGYVDHAWFNVVWVAMVAVLMVSRVPTYSIKKLVVRHENAVYVMAAAGLLIALMIIEPWFTFPMIGLTYATSILFSVMQARRTR